MEGFTPFWDVLFAHAEDRAAHEPAVREPLTAEATRWQHTHGVRTRVTRENGAAFNTPGSRAAHGRLTAHTSDNDLCAQRR